MSADLKAARAEIEEAVLDALADHKDWLAEHSYAPDHGPDATAISVSSLRTLITALDQAAEALKPPTGVIPDQAWSGNRGNYGQMQEAASTLPTLSLEEKIARLICTHFKDPLATLDLPPDAFEYEWFYDWAWERAIIRARAILATVYATLKPVDTKEGEGA